MKKILTILFVLSFTIGVFAQAPKQLNAYNPQTQVNFLGPIANDSGLVFRYNFPDTTTANLGWIKNIPNVFVVIDDTLRKRSNDATRWMTVGSGSGGGGQSLTLGTFLTGGSYDGSSPITTGVDSSDAAFKAYIGHYSKDSVITIYTGDGSLSGDRSVDLGEFFLKMLYESRPVWGWIPPDENFGSGDAFQYSWNVDGATVQAAGMEAIATQTDATAILQSSYDVDGAVKQANILYLSNASGTSGTYTADTHTFNGTVDLSDIVHSGNINYTATAHLFTGTMTLLGLAGNGVGIASVGNDGSLGWTTGNANLLVDSIGTVGQAIVVPRGDTLYHRLLRGGLYTTADTVVTSGEVRVNIDTAASGLHTLIALYGAPTMAAVGASPNANGGTISAGVLTLQPASASFPGVITTGTQPIAGQKTFSSAFFPTGGTFTNTTAITSNWVLQGGGVGTANTSAIISLGGNNAVGNRGFMSGSTTYTVTAASAYANFIIGNMGMTEASSGVHPLAAAMAIKGLTITNGTATTTDATSLYIEGPPGGTATITNPVTSLWVDAGLVRFDGGMQTAYIAKGVDYTATTSDYVIEVTATGKTITLPTAASSAGLTFIIKLSASGSGTVGTTSSQTIDGSTTYSLSAQYKYVAVQSNGSNWNVIGNN